MKSGNGETNHQPITLMDRQTKKKEKKRDKSASVQRRKRVGVGGTNGERLHPTRPWCKHDLASPRTSPHPTPPGGVREQDRKGKDVGGGVRGALNSHLVLHLPAWAAGDG